MYFTSKLLSWQTTRCRNFLLPVTKQQSSTLFGIKPYEIFPAQRSIIDYFRRSLPFVTTSPFLLLLNFFLNFLSSVLLAIFFAYFSLTFFSKQVEIKFILILIVNYRFKFIATVQNVIIRREFRILEKLINIEKLLMNFIKVLTFKGLK